jgi:hypothetical protein
MRHERDVSSGAALMQRHPQSVENEVGAHVACELPADDHSAVGVDHEAEEHQPLPAAQVGEVREPLLFRPLSREITLDPVRVANRRRVGFRGAPRLDPSLGALNAVLAHRAFHPAAADILALT